MGPMLRVTKKFPSATDTHPVFLVWSIRLCNTKTLFLLYDEDHKEWVWKDHTLFELCEEQDGPAVYISHNDDEKEHVRYKAWGISIYGNDTLFLLYDKTIFPNGWHWVDSVTYHPSHYQIPDIKFISFHK